jgi:hypothetical protein
MMDIFQNPFSGFYFQSAQKNSAVADLSSIVNSDQYSPLISSSWNAKDEYVSSAPPSSGTYKRPSIPTIPSASRETASPKEVTDKMREEMTYGDSYWSTMDLLPIAYN